MNNQHSSGIMKFEEWFENSDYDVYGYPEEAMEAAWDAAIYQAAKLVAEPQELLVEAVNVIRCYSNSDLMGTSGDDMIEKIEKYLTK